MVGTPHGFTVTELVSGGGAPRLAEGGVRARGVLHALLCRGVSRGGSTLCVETAPLPSSSFGLPQPRLLLGTASRRSACPGAAGGCSAYLGTAGRRSVYQV